MPLGMVGVFFGGAAAVLPIYATDVLHVGATGFGWMRAMPSIGAIFMSLWLGTRPPARRGGGGAAWGAGDNISVVIRSTVLQLLTPDSMRGRVSAVGVIFIGTSNEIGEFESGVAAQWLGLLPAGG